MTYYKKHVFICTNQKAEGKQCCAIKGGAPFAEYLKEHLKKRDALGPNKIRVTQSGCLGRCALGPCLVIYPEGVWYTYENTADLDEIIDCVLLQEKKLDRLLLPG